MTEMTSKEEFEEIAQKAFELLPDVFTARVENVRIVVEDLPSDDALERTRASRSTLLGLYQGIPLTHRGTWYGTSPTMPDKITLYKRNIEAVCKNVDDIRARIQEVLYHELGHYFGMNEAEIRRAMKAYQ